MAFIAAHAAPGATILDIGCGAGHVARELQRLGFAATGVDSDEDRVMLARERGRPVLHATWPAFKSALVDAVVFTRSLHHIGPLAAAVCRARDLLRPTGALLVEDFAFDSANRATIEWFVKALGTQRARQLVAATPDEFVTDLLAAGDPVAGWHQHHDHDLHTVEAMTRAISEHFAIRSEQSVPYLYRYLIPVLAETAETAALVEEIRQVELRLGGRGDIRLIGRRIVAVPREDLS